MPLGSDAPSLPLWGGRSVSRGRNLARWRRRRGRTGAPVPLGGAWGQRVPLRDCFPGRLVPGQRAGPRVGNVLVALWRQRTVPHLESFGPAHFSLVHSPDQKARALRPHGDCWIMLSGRSWLSFRSSSTLVPHLSYNVVQL